MNENSAIKLEKRKNIVRKHQHIQKWLKTSRKWGELIKYQSKQNIWNELVEVLIIIIHFYINHLMIAGKSLGKKFNTDQRPLVIQIILMFPDPKLESF